MALNINGVAYFSTAEVLQALGLSRVTLWRWRHEGKIPQGHRLRGRQLVFTNAEVEAIRNFALRVEPIGNELTGQLPLFGANQRYESFE
jgi:predicted DNA-binding transcriptional regulator AlpA